MYKYEPEILDYLKKSHKIGIVELAQALEVSQDALMRPTASLEEKGYLVKQINSDSKFNISEEGRKYKSSMFPECRVLLNAMNGKTVAELSEDEKRFGLKWAKKKGWIEVADGGKLIPKTKLLESELSAFSSNLPQINDLFYSKDELIERGILIENIEKQTLLEITPAGLKAELSIDGITTLTSEILRTKKWKGAKFKPYDITIPAKNAELGRLHPITIAMNRIRRVFADLGFEEMQGDYIQSAFWNFDALFQPQDHPARELADTFYLEGEEPLPEKKLVSRIKEVHEKGWLSRWEEKEAKRRVLRTHTTALSARYLANMKTQPKKYFSIGRVFRNEATDFKHLAEFCQVEGIIASEKANFRELLGILKEFYRKLGFEEIRFRPSFFPYTEPSLEIECYFKDRKKWIEMGGAGVMRPEVSIPLADTYPVLAWGLSLERPLMLLMGVNDIRTFYKNDLDWLEKSRVSL
ncbi:phenylalanine--tRNA ligase subunit alpha [Candidatus Micrarchaeota archaeon]|nr:phenylalanine--tRNA ligase subunit alpha [Candidatus Micrarchaeota archaeon]